jgi:hypothetical protein
MTIETVVATTSARGEEEHHTAGTTRTVSWSRLCLWVVKRRENDGDWVSARLKHHSWDRLCSFFHFRVTGSWSIAITTRPIAIFQSHSHTRILISS